MFDSINSLAYFEIQSSQPERDAKFYSEVFGWGFEKDENIPIEYYRLQTPLMHGAILQRPAPTPPKGGGTNGFVCSIHVADFDQTAEKILSLGGDVALPKFAIPNKCWQGYFLDLDNNVFGIFQPDESAG